MLKDYIFAKFHRYSLTSSGFKTRNLSMTQRLFFLIYYPCPHLLLYLMTPCIYFYISPKNFLLRGLLTKKNRPKCLPKGYY